MYTSAPRITYDEILNEPVAFRSGATLYIEVTVSGYPRPDIHWYHDDKEMLETARVTTETIEGWSYVKVKAISADDAGSYSVKAENTAGKDTATFKIVIMCMEFFYVKLK